MNYCRLSPTHIYLTHLHWDHFHGPSLRYFSKFNPILLLPKSFTRRMVRDARACLTYSSIVELDHGRRFQLDDQVCVTSYQFNFDSIDSSLAIEGNSYPSQSQ